MGRFARIYAAIAAMTLTILVPAAAAHPLIQDALDVVIGPDQISIEARISAEEIAVEDKLAASDQLSEAAIKNHGDYLLKHLRLEADGQVIGGSLIGQTKAPSPMHGFHLQYSLGRSPREIKLSQTLLIDRAPWNVSCIVRFRQSNQQSFQTALLTREETADFGCDWTPSVTTTQPATFNTAIPIGPTFRAYLRHGIRHILTGYDHLLFISALVLAACSLWDLVKVVTAFTLAHTLTLCLSVYGIVHVAERLVEPMIAASIVLVAMQNLFWPRASRGWPRLGIAFAFGLFHGLGFAGGLTEAMNTLPRPSVAVALVAFSLGVELGHQVVVIPLFALLSARRRSQVDAAPLWFANIRRVGSSLICVGGIYFLAQSLLGFRQ